MGLLSTSMLTADLGAIEADLPQSATLSRRARGEQTVPVCASEDGGARAFMEGAAGMDYDDGPSIVVRRDALVWVPRQGDACRFAGKVYRVTSVTSVEADAAITIYLRRRQ